MYDATKLKNISTQIIAKQSCSSTFLVTAGVSFCINAVNFSQPILLISTLSPRITPSLVVVRCRSRKSFSVTSKFPFKCYTKVFNCALRVTSHLWLKLCSMQYSNHAVQYLLSDINAILLVSFLLFICIFYNLWPPLC